MGSKRVFVSLTVDDDMPLGHVATWIDMAMHDPTNQAPIDSTVYATAQDLYDDSQED